MRSDIKLSQGDYEDCSKDIQSAVKIGQEMGYKAIIASAQVKRGRLALLQSDIDQAKKILEEALALYGSQDNKKTAAFNLYNLGRVACEQNDPELSKKCFKQSLQLFYEMNFWYWDYIAYSLEGLGKLALMQQHAGEAARLYGAARRLFQGLSNTLSPLERKWREETLTSARTLLGDELYQHLWDEGYAMTTEEVVKCIE